MVKLRGYSGVDEAWEVYYTHIELVRAANQWDESTALLHFCTELSGVALEYYRSLDHYERAQYFRLMGLMRQRFGTMTNLEAVRGQLEMLRQKPEHTLQDLGQQVRHLAYAVYAEDPATNREMEAVRVHYICKQSHPVR